MHALAVPLRNLQGHGGGAQRGRITQQMQAHKHCSDMLPLLRKPRAGAWAAVVSDCDDTTHAPRQYTTLS